MVYLNTIFLLSFFLVSKKANLDSADFFQLGFQDPATPLMEGVVNFHNPHSRLIVGVGVFVIWLLARCLSLYNSPKTKDSRDQFTHATTVEIFWTVVPEIAVPSFALLY